MLAFFPLAEVGHSASWDGDRCGTQHKQFEPVRVWLISTLWDIGWIFLLQPGDKSLNDSPVLLHLPIVCVYVCVCFIYFPQCLTLKVLCAFWDVLLNDFSPKCQKSGFYVLLIPLYTHYINTPRRRPFAWKFSWFMSRFYSISYNQPAHFCMGLVVAVVIPQYSAGARLQRAFCSHAPSQKHRVTSLASSGKGGPAGFTPPPPTPTCVHFSLFPPYPQLFFRSLFLRAFAPEIYNSCCW